MNTPNPIWFKGLVVGLLIGLVPESTPLAGLPRTPITPVRPPGQQLVSTTNLMTSVRWLADDARQGRMTGSAGGNITADWIASRFDSLGLAPGGDSGSYFQNLEVTIGAALGETNDFSMFDRDVRESYRVEKDFIPFPFSENGDVELPLVFVGYGITAPELGYDDYEGLDVEGKAVLMLRHEPQQHDGDSIFNGADHSAHAFFRNKAENAIAHGAAAMLLFTGPQSPNSKNDPLLPLGRGAELSGGGLPAIQIKRTIGERLLQSAGVEIREWGETVDRDLNPGSFAFDPGLRVRLQVDVERERNPAANIIGILPGTNPEAGALILGAHYDHLGHGPEGSLAPEHTGEVHNGADDNASGVAALIELARIFRLTEPPTRTLIFAAFTGEELGLLGSAHMASHSPVPLSRVQAMLNLDMVGRPDGNMITVGGVGTSTMFPDLIDRLDAATSLSLNISESGFGPSDHTSFFTMGVPVLFFFSGLHEDYHKPSDDWDKIDPDGLAEVTRVVYNAALELANRSDRLEITGDSPENAADHGLKGLDPDREP